MPKLNNCCRTCHLISKVFGYIPEDDGTEWLYRAIKKQFEHEYIRFIQMLDKHPNSEFLLRVMKAQNHPIASFIEKVLEAKSRAADEVQSSAAL